MFPCLLTSLAALASVASLAQGVALPRAPTGSSLTSRQTAVSSTTVDGKAFVNHGLVGFGQISGDSYDSYGESLGGLGSAISLESFKKSKKRGDSSYTGTIRLQPDRGHNQGGAATSDYRARSHLFSFTFSPLTDSATSATKGENLHLTYKNSVLYKYKRNYTTGLNPDGALERARGRKPLPTATYNDHVTFDTEGLVDAGGFLIVSDEYGPYVYAIDKKTGSVLGVLTPPDAILPMINGSPNFTATSDPDTGRVANQGFEGVTISTSKKTLYLLLQSGTVQDGGSSDTSSPYTRLLGYSYAHQSLAEIISNGFSPKLVEEYVVKLPTSKKGKTRGASELHSLGNGIFALLARDGNGFGDDSSDSSYKEVGLISTTGATNIAGTKYDSPSSPIAPGGKLVGDITPAVVEDWLSLIEDSQLAKFGLHNGGAVDGNLIAAKLESLAVASVQDSQYPDDYFLFVVSDNDFITLKGKQAGQINGTGPYVLQDYADPYAVENGITQDTQAFIYRVTLPGYKESTPN